ncbi:MAG TPA: mechanosensitive ion channel family protein [Polyangiaceae bacterium]|nr:mechanosensitive ion channel family protein [Polyangiaceae bacterium]
MGDKVQSMDRLLTVLIEKGTVFVGRAAIVLVVFTLAWVLAGWAQRGILRAFGRANHVDATLVRFLASAVRYGLLIASLISCLSAFGITATSFAAVLGAAGIAIGLAFQGTLSNFAAGLMLLLFRPFRVGDTIKAGAYSGTVKALELFSTVLVTSDNRRVVLPNSSLSNQPLENITYFPTRRAEILLPFPLRASSEQLLSRLVALATALPHVHTDPGPDAKIQDFRDRNMNVLLGAWCDTEHHATLMASLALVGKQVLDEARARQPLTPKSRRGDAAVE